MAAIPIHEYPVPPGALVKTQYDDPSQWPFIDAQGHWVPGGGSPTVQPPNTLVPNMAHSHIGFHTPIWGELGNENITLPFTLKLFHCAGKIVEVSAEYIGALFPKPIYTITTEQSLPIIGDPNGLVQVNGTFTFNLADGLDAGVSKHGWASVLVQSTVSFDNGDILKLQFTQSFYSVIDTTVPETRISEGGINVSAKAFGVRAGDGNGVFGTHLTEFRGLIPILVPFNTPQSTDVFAYNYGIDPNLPEGVYELRIDPDLHMGVPGTLVTTTRLAGNDGNFDVLDPVQIAASIPPMGYETTPGKHRLSFDWIRDVPNGFTDQNGVVRVAGQQLRSLLNIDVYIGDNPQDGIPPIFWGQVVPGPDGPIIAPSPEFTTMPNVVGLPQSEATSLITTARLVVGTISNQSSDTIPKGNIISQFPAGGAMVNVGSVTNLVSSTGAGTNPLPTLIGPVDCYKNADGTYMFCAKDPALPPNQHLCIENVPIVDEELP